MVDASIVSSLLLKLGEATLQEAITLYGVDDRVQFMEREMGRVRSFLQDADSKSKGDNRVQNWIKDVRGVSFLIEDVIDTFLLEVGRNVGFFRSIGKVLKKPHVLHKLNSDIDKIQTILAEIERSRVSYEIKDLPESSSRVPHVKRQINPDLENTDIVGVDAEKNGIIDLLLDEHTLRRSVVSIVGIGGLGKTTLAHKIYRSEKVKKHFAASIWLNISQEFNTTDLLKKMTEILAIKLEKHEREKEHFIPKINEVLKGKRYLVVLDDIWTDGDLWNEMMEMKVLPDVNNGSRVLITTRFFEIAKAADPKSDPYNLRFLNEEESMDLLFKKAYVDKIDNESYPHDLLQPAKTFSKKCSGLPLALVVVGGLLSTKPQTSLAWNRIVGTMNWKIGENECMKILATSFEDLPMRVKPCFIYLASFPEDWVYDAKLIIQLWVAEGFVHRDEPGTTEEIADNYLEELAQRCMIQNIERSLTDGSITHFRVHDLLLELAIQKANQKSFLKVFSKQAHFENTSDARRATFQLGDSSWYNSSFEQKKLIEYTKLNIRSLVFFGKIIPFGSQFKLLKVLMVENFSFSRKQQSGLWNSLKGLLHLRCLVIRNCYFISNNYGICLPIDHNLQTLDLKGSDRMRVSALLLGIKTLRHIFGVDIKIGRDPDDRPNLQSLIGRGLAPTHLPYLRTLDRLIIYKSDGIELLNLPSLRRLSLKNKSGSWESILTLIGKLGCLVSLEISGDTIPLGITDTRSFPSYGLLQTLHMYGEWSREGVTISADIFPPNLTELTLRRSYIDQDPMPILEKLQFLKILTIGRHAYKGKKMICSRGGFPHLQKLTLDDLDELEEWKIEEGAMPMLNHLKIRECENLKMLPDMQYVPTLYALELLSRLNVFKQRVQNEDQHKIKHIQSIIIKKYW